MSKFISINVKNNNILKRYENVKHDTEYTLVNSLLEFLYTNSASTNIFYPFYISEISPDGTELLIKPVNKDIKKIPNYNNNTGFLFDNTFINNLSFNYKQGDTDISLNDLQKYVLQLQHHILIEDETISKSLYPIINVAVFDENKDTLVLKLYKKISKNNVNVRLNFVKLYNNHSIAHKYIDYEYLEEQKSIEYFKTLPKIVLEPNIDLSLNKFHNSSKEISFKNYNELLNNNSDNENINLISFINKKNLLNVDYSVFKEFIHFSSGKIRLENFKIKLENIFDINNKISTINSILTNTTGNENESVFSKNQKNKLLLKKQQIIDNFTDYEYYLYFKKESEFKKSINQYSIDSSWPKDDNGNCLPLSDSNCSTWYNKMLLELEEYDSNNMFNFLNFIPNYIISENENIEYIKLLNLTGEYLDKIYIVLKNLVTYKIKYDNVKHYFNKEIFISLLKSSGLDVENNNAYAEIINYFSSVAESNCDYTLEEMSFEIWNRLYVNDYTINSFKGTKEAIELLLSVYGIPNLLLDIEETSIKTKDNIETTQEYKSIDKYCYKANTGKILFDHSNITLFNYPLTMTFNIYLRKNINTDYTILYDSDDNSIIKYDSSTKSIVLINSSDDVIFNTSLKNNFRLDKPFQITLKYYDSNLSLVVSQFARNEYTKVDFPVITNYRKIYNDSNNIRFSINNNIMFRELFVWNNYEYTDSDIELQTKFPQRKNLLNGNIDKPLQDIIDYLLIHYEMNGDFIESKSNNELYINSTDCEFKSFYFTNIIHNTNIDDFNVDKIRIIDTKKSDVRLYPSHKIDNYSDNYKIEDTNSVSVYFTPSKLINSSITSIYANYNFDNALGDIADENKEYYTILKEEEDNFNDMFTFSDNITDYVQQFDKSLFSQIESMLPLRANKFVGILIKPTLFERNKQKTFNKTMFNTSENSKVAKLNTEYNVKGFNNTIEFNLSPSIDISANDNVRKTNIKIDYNCIKCKSLEIEAKFFKPKYFKKGKKSQITLSKNNIFKVIDRDKHKWDGNINSDNPVTRIIINENEKLINNNVIKLN